jgi:mycofactocin precursor
MDSNSTVVTEADQPAAAALCDTGTSEVVEEVLLEEISIDGMCGVY